VKKENEQGKRRGQRGKKILKEFQSIKNLKIEKRRIKNG